MAPIEPIPATDGGWPYLPDNAPIADQPAYTQALAAALSGFTPGSGAATGDSGWLTLDGGQCMYRKIGVVVSVRAFYTIASLAAGAALDPLFTLPVGFRPSVNPQAVAAESNNPPHYNVMGQIRTDGRCVIRNTGTAAVTQVVVSATFII